MSTWTDNLTMETMAKERANPPFDVRKVRFSLSFNPSSDPRRSFETDV